MPPLMSPAATLLRDGEMQRGAALAAMPARGRGARRAASTPRRLFSPGRRLLIAA